MTISTSENRRELSLRERLSLAQYARRDLHEHVAGIGEKTRGAAPIPHSTARPLGAAHTAVWLQVRLDARYAPRIQPHSPRRAPCSAPAVSHRQSFPLAWSLVQSPVARPGRAQQGSE